MPDGVLFMRGGGVYSGEKVVQRPSAPVFVQAVRRRWGNAWDDAACRKTALSALCEPRGEMPGNDEQRTAVADARGRCVRRNIVSGVQRLGALATDGEMMGGVMARIGERPMCRRRAADLSDGGRRLWMALKRPLDAGIENALRPLARASDGFSAGRSAKGVDGCGQRGMTAIKTGPASAGSWPRCIVQMW